MGVFCNIIDEVHKIGGFLGTSHDIRRLPVEVHRIGGFLASSCDIGRLHLKIWGYNCHYLAKRGAKRNSSTGLSAEAGLPAGIPLRLEGSSPNRPASFCIAWNDLSLAATSGIIWR